MKRERRFFYTGRMTDGSDRGEHIEYVWTERYMGRDYETKRVTDPMLNMLTVVDDAETTAAGEIRRADAHRVDPTVDIGGSVDISLMPPTPEEVADVLADNDVAALVDKARIVTALRTNSGQK